jgi:hypothetical protein
LPPQVVPKGHPSELRIYNSGVLAPGNRFNEIVK